MKLNLGCGSHKMDGYINIDCQEGYSPDIVSDINNLKYDNNSIDEIYMSHVLEHMIVSKANEAVENCYKWLKKDGLFYVAVPDLTKVCRALASGDDGLITFYWIYGGGGGGCMSHYWGFTERRLVKVMNDFGFEKVSYFEGMNDDSNFERNGEKWSLNIVFKK